MFINVYMTCAFEILNLGGASEKHKRVEHPPRRIYQLVIYELIQHRIKFYATSIPELKKIYI